MLPSPHPQEERWVPCQEPALPPAAPGAPSPTSGKMLGTKTKLLSYPLSWSWALRDPEDQATILRPLSPH